MAPLPGARPLPILSRRSAIGLVIATGSVGRAVSLLDDYNIYRSTDGGLYWHEV